MTVEKPSDREEKYFLKMDMEKRIKLDKTWTGHELRKNNKGKRRLTG